MYYHSHPIIVKEKLHGPREARVCAHDVHGSSLKSRWLPETMLVINGHVASSARPI